MYFIFTSYTVPGRPVSMPLLSRLFLTCRVEIAIAYPPCFAGGLTAVLARSYQSQIAASAISLRFPFCIYSSSPLSISSRSLFSPIPLTLLICSTVLSMGSKGAVWLAVSFFAIRKTPFRKMAKKYNTKMGFSSDGCWQQLHGSFTPSHACGCAAQCCEGVQRGSIIVLPVRSSPASCHACFAARCCSLCFSLTGKSGHGAPAVRLGTGRMCPILPYAAPPLICAAFFVKEQTGQIYAKRKGVKRFAFTYLP